MACLFLFAQNLNPMKEGAELFKHMFPMYIYIYMCIYLHIDIYIYTYESVHFKQFWFNHDSYPKIENLKGRCFSV